LFALFNTEIVNLNIDTMSWFEKSNYIFFAVSNGSFDTLCWVTKSNDMVCNIGQV
jgi:hypothetical protein